MVRLPPVTDRAAAFAEARHVTDALLLPADTPGLAADGAACGAICTWQIIGVATPPDDVRSVCVAALVGGSPHPTMNAAADIRTLRCHRVVCIMLPLCEPVCPTREIAGRNCTETRQSRGLPATVSRLRLGRAGAVRGHRTIAGGARCVSDGRAELIEF